MPKTPQDKEYQLWFIKEGKPYDAGTFAVSKEEDFFNLSISVPTDAKVFAVTIEPKGGSKAPTTTPVLVGSI